MAQQPNQQYPQQQQQQQQPYMMMPPQPQPPQMWAPSAQPPPQSVAPPQPTSADEVRTLWIGDLQYWMDENYLYTCFAHTGEVYFLFLIFAFLSQIVLDIFAFYLCSMESLLDFNLKLLWCGVRFRICSHQINLLFLVRQILFIL